MIADGPRLPPFRLERGQPRMCVAAGWSAAAAVEVRHVPVVALARISSHFRDAPRQRLELAPHHLAGVTLPHPHLSASAATSRSPRPPSSSDAAQESASRTSPSPLSWTSMRRVPSAGSKQRRRRNPRPGGTPCSKALVTSSLTQSNTSSTRTSHAQSTRASRTNCRTSGTDRRSRRWNTSRKQESRVVSFTPPTSHKVTTVEQRVGSYRAVVRLLTGQSGFATGRGNSCNRQKGTSGSRPGT